jgi:hypothetical protein
MGTSIATAPAITATPTMSSSGAPRARGIRSRRSSTSVPRVIGIAAIATSISSRSTPASKGNTSTTISSAKASRTVR